MALPPTASSASSPPSSFSCFTNSVSSLFLSCIQTRRIKKGRHSPNSPTATPNNNNNRASCSHAIAARKCTCAYISPADTIAEKEPETLPSLDSNTISITHRTSIRIVESDSSSDYDSRTSLDSDVNSVSDYGCGCGSEVPEHHHEPDHGYQQHTYEDDEKLSARPLPPLPSATTTTTTITHTALSRKHPEIKTRLIEETIPEEDEDEYLEQQESQSQPERKDQDPKQSKGAATGSRRKSMIELFNLSSSRSGSTPSSPSAASSNPGLSLSFSNLHFRFPLPPAWGQQQQQQQQQEHHRDGNEGNQSQDQKGERKRPMSTSALPSSTTPSASSAKKQARGVSLHSALTRSQPVESENTSTTTTTTKQAAVTTKKERRMATIVFPPLARLSRSGMNGNNNRGSTTPVAGRSLFS
ncbi:hypothetical protein ASPVEDRAFT_88238 [Aspergillus versicolor CBS 583.65]|uniref:Uncharacterized protein n=1 Tax=Aspergillus versicolor CBS 583.65 TaxID=1036611 RepID=A0A1L9PZL3_ASPVE|nr:uncharacterized protein ASPVEDRAFT_88238 [Aspergillus versicolor CBS 583.65]OJJ06971.1 hypothetical protein ASPVEDRAFT_88238 [Aspergillus versicolor CBS 583.65]